MHFLFSLIFSRHNHAPARRCARNLAASLENVQAGRQKTQSFKGRRGIEDQEIGWFVFFDTIAILDAQRLRRVGRN